MSALLAPVRGKVAKLLPRLASNHDQEVVATARAIERSLRVDGRDRNDLARAIARDPSGPQEAPKDWEELVRYVFEVDKGRLAPHERKFVADMLGRLVLHGTPTAKQADWLRALYAKLLRCQP